MGGLPKLSFNSSEVIPYIKHKDTKGGWYAQTKDGSSPPRFKRVDITRLQSDSKGHL